MKEKLVIALFSILLCAASAFGEVTIKAEVDKAKITSDEAITYKLTITSFEKNVPSPQLPEFKGFEIVSQSESSSASFTKSELKVVIVYAFVLVPADTGKLIIEPSSIKINDVTYASDSFEIEVSPGKIKPTPKPKKEPSLPEELLPETGQPQITL